MRQVEERYRLLGPCKHVWIAAWMFGSRPKQEQLNKEYMKIIYNMFAAIVDYFDLQSQRRNPKLGDKFRR